MLDITGFRVEYGGNPEVVRESQRRRKADETLVDMVIESDSAWRIAGHTLQKLQGDLSKAKAAAHAARKEQQLDEAERLLDRVKALGVEVAAAAGVEATSHLDAQRRLTAVSNLVHEHAPVRAAHDARCTVHGARCMVHGAQCTHRVASCVPLCAAFQVRVDDDEPRARPAGLHSAARRLIDAGLAEACGSGSWRPAGRGLLLREQASPDSLASLASPAPLSARLPPDPTLPRMPPHATRHTPCRPAPCLPPPRPQRDRVTA